MIRLSQQPKWTQALVGLVGYLVAMVLFVGVVIVIMAIDPPRSVDHHLEHRTVRPNSN